MFNEAAEVATGYLRESAKEVGDILKEAHNARMQEVNSLLTLQAQMNAAVQSVNLMDATAEGFNFSVVV